MRTVVHAKRFLEALARIEADPVRVDDFIFAFDWALARKPEIGIKVTDEPLIWMIQSVQSMTMPPLHVYYTFNEAKVFLLGVRPV